ncbi:MAG: hypothetical protein ABI831_06860 [Betaproteobacteria bacterium]
MRVEMDLDDGVTVEFCSGNAGGPFPYLRDVGQLRNAARAGAAAGLIGTESASVTIAFENCPQSAEIIGQPLRRAVRAYDDADALFFEGFVSSIEYDAAITVEVGA